MTFEIILAIIGLALAFIELWVPKLSSSLESWMTAIVRPLMTAARALKNTPALIVGTLDGFTKRTLPGLLIAGLPALVILFLVDAFDIKWAKASIFTVPLALILLVTLIPLALSIAYRFFGGYVTYPIYLLSLVVALPAWCIKLANKMGNGKGVSGFGLLLACWGVIGPLVS